jgi:hypothetical protein
MARIRIIHAESIWNYSRYNDRHYPYCGTTEPTVHSNIAGYEECVTVGSWFRGKTFSSMKGTVFWVVTHHVVWRQHSVAVKHIICTFRVKE